MQVLSRLFSVPQLTGFRSNTSGAIAPIFAGLISFLVLVTGTAIEMGRWAIARNELQASLDAAVLAGAAKLQLNQADKAGAIDAAKKAFKANRSKQRFGADIVENITFSVEGSSLYAKGDADIVTVLGKVVGVNSLALLGTSGATGENAIGSVATITNNKFELSLMLDITGSMCDRAPGLDDAPCTKGEKLDAMKKAAQDLVNSMLATDELKTRVRVAVVPFSDGVRLPALPKLAAAGVVPAVQTFTDNTCDKWGNCETKNYYYHPTDCVVERIESKTYTGVTRRYTDDAPGLGQYVTTLMRRGKSATNSTPQEAGCSMGESSVVMPLSSNKDAILATISALSAKGGTAGQVGTAWTWYTLSRNWKDVWAGSSDDAASPENDKTLRKIAILMTDGDYNTEFAQGGYYPGSWAFSSNKAGNNVTNGTSQAQAQALCTGMKKDIEVYTIGYQVSSAAETFLNQCATDASHAFKADSATELQAVFKGIGQRVMALYLSQ